MSGPSIDKQKISGKDEETDLTNVIRIGDSHGLDYLDKDRLAGKINTPVTIRNAILIASSEDIANAIAKNAARIKFSVKVSVDSANITRYQLSVSDDGSKKFTKEDLLKILDYDHASSSKRGLFTKRPGCKGNASKAKFTLSCVLAEEAGVAPPPIIVKSGPKQFSFTLSRNILRQKIDYDLKEEDRDDDGFTIVEVIFAQKNLDSITAILIRSSLYRMISGVHLFAPWLTIDYEIPGTISTLKASANKLRDQKEKTSALFYTQVQLRKLLLEYVLTTPKLKYKKLCNELFRDFSKEAPLENLQNWSSFTLESKNPIYAKIPDVALKPDPAMSEIPAELFDAIALAMKYQSNPIQKRSIPSFLLPYPVDVRNPNEIPRVREESIRKVAEANGWSNMRYKMEALSIIRCPYGSEPHRIQECQEPNHVEFPVILEIAAFDHSQEDGQGLQVFEGVNYMSSLESHLFERVYSIATHLIKAGVSESTPLTLLIHLVTPVQDCWLNEGKTDIDLPEIKGFLEKMMRQVLPIRKKPKSYRPKRVSNFVPRGTIGNPKYEAALKNFADYLKSVQAELQKTRSKQKFGARSWGYFLEDGIHVSKGDFDAVEDAIGDARKLGFIPILGFIAEDQDETRRFSGLLTAVNPAEYLQDLKEEVSSMLNRLAELNTNFWEGEKYFLMMVTEKGDIKRLFEPICDPYHVPLVSTKGWSPIEIRALIAKFAKEAEARGQIPVLLQFYDLDIAGRKISRTFRKNLGDCSPGTGYDPGTEENPKLIIKRIGLDKEQVDKYGLTWINNLLSSSGKDLTGTDPEYEQEIGVRKCESNALFKNERTIQAAESICRDAIEDYYGRDAIERFKRREEETKQKYGDIYENPIWGRFKEELDKIADTCRKKTPEETQGPRKQEVIVKIRLKDGKFYLGNCPCCGQHFDYKEEEDIGKVKVCRFCKTPMLLALEEEKEDQVFSR